MMPYNDIQVTIPRTIQPDTAKILTYLLFKSRGIRLKATFLASGPIISMSKIKATTNPGKKPRKACLHAKAPATCKFQILIPKTIIAHIIHVNNKASLKFLGILVLHSLINYSLTNQPRSAYKQKALVRTTFWKIFY